MAFGDETHQILGQLRSYLARVADDHLRTMAAAWARAWDDISPELVAALAELQADAVDGRLTRAQIIRARRLTNALALIETSLGGLVDQSAQAIIEQLGAVVDQAGQTTDRLISSQLPHGEKVTGWDRVDADQVAAIVQRTTERITKASFPLSDEATAAMKRQLVRGMLTGANPREVARRTIRSLEGTFNGGLGRATMIARTEMLDAHRNATQLAEQAHTDVLESWIWTAALTARTCRACWGMNGEEFPLEVSGPDGHQNCRCARVPKTKTWAELGFDIEEPPSLVPSTQTVFDQLPVPDQRDILGARGFDAWKAGKYPPTAWATKRSNDAWRDSYVPSKAPAAA